MANVTDDNDKFTRTDAFKMFWKYFMRSHRFQAGIFTQYTLHIQNGILLKTSPPLDRKTFLAVIKPARFRPINHYNRVREACETVE